MNTSRRDFLFKSSVGGAALISIPAIVSSCINHVQKGEKASTFFESGNTILFQGDSITDAGRERERELPNSGPSFGGGYAFLAASYLLNAMPEKQLTIYNRGISGNKVFQLADRWDKDCLDLNPDVLSILIGVNDYWHKRNGKYEGTVEIYENDYMKLLERTQKALPDIKLVLCEPFYVLDTIAVDETWVEPMKQYQAAAKRVSEAFDTLWVPFQTVFDEAIKYAPGKYWTGDGVHPSMAGAQLMAEAWLKVVN